MKNMNVIKVSDIDKKRLKDFREKLSEQEFEDKKKESRTDLNISYGLDFSRSIYGTYYYYSYNFLRTSYGSYLKNDYINKYSDKITDEYKKRDGAIEYLHNTIRNGQVNYILNEIDEIYIEKYLRYRKMKKLK